MANLPESTSLKKIDSPLPYHHQLSIALQLEVGTDDCPALMLECSPLGLVQATTTVVIS